MRDGRSASSIRSSEVFSSIPVWGSEIIFLKIELYELASLIQDISKLPNFKNIYLIKRLRFHRLS